MRYLKIAALIACVAACAVTAAAQGNCSTEMLQGTYVIEHTGLVYMGITAPYSLLGTMTADAQGNVTNRAIQVNPFGVVPPPDPLPTGHWTVTPDCKLTLTLNGGAAVSEGLVIHNGEEIRAMITKPLVRSVPGVPDPLPAVGSGVLRRMSSSANGVHNCSASTARGTYAQTCSGYIPIPGANPPATMTFLPSRAMLTVTINGDGTAEGSGQLVFGGQIHQGVYHNLTYEVEPDCWATASFEIEGAPGTWKEAMLIWDGGKEMLSTTLSGPTGQIDMCRFTRIDPKLTPGLRPSAPRLRAR